MDFVSNTAKTAQSDNVSDITTSVAEHRLEQEEPAPVDSVFSSHWSELAGMLGNEAKAALSEHLDRTQDLAISASALPTPRSIVSGGDFEPPPLSARSVASHSSGLAMVDEIIEKHAQATATPIHTAAAPTAKIETDEEFIVRKEHEAAEEFAQAVADWRIEKSKGGGEAKIIEAGGDFGSVGASEDGDGNEEPNTNANIKEEKEKVPDGSVNTDFSKLEYWDSRFKDEKQYDWLLTFEQVKQQLLPLLQPYTKNACILIVGCGNSTFSADLYDEGYTNITNIDYSPTVIEHMHKEHSTTRPKMKWVVADMTTMTFPDRAQEQGAFDIVIDKAALDAIMVDEGSVWDPYESVIAAADSTCYRVREMFPKQQTPTVHTVPASLSTRNLYVMISFMQPHFRTKYLMGTHADRMSTPPLREDMHDKTSAYAAATGYCERYDWTVQWEAIKLEDAGSFEHFLYIMRTGKDEKSENRDQED